MKYTRKNDYLFIDRLWLEILFYFWLIFFELFLFLNHVSFGVSEIVIVIASWTISIMLTGEELWECPLLYYFVIFLSSYSLLLSSFYAILRSFSFKNIRDFFFFLPCDYVLSLMTRDELQSISKKSWGRRFLFVYLFVFVNLFFLLKMIDLCCRLPISQVSLNKTIMKSIRAITILSFFFISLSSIFSFHNYMSRATTSTDLVFFYILTHSFMPGSVGATLAIKQCKMVAYLKTNNRANHKQIL